MLHQNQKFMEQLNQVHLRGRVGNTQVQKVGEGQVCHLSVATNYLTRTQEGAGIVEEVTWHNCTVWAGKKYPDLSVIGVGSGIDLLGRLRVRKYTGADDVVREVSEIVVTDFSIVPQSEPLKAESRL